LIYKVSALAKNANIDRIATPLREFATPYEIFATPSQRFATP